MKSSGLLREAAQLAVGFGEVEHATLTTGSTGSFRRDAEMMNSAAEAVREGAGIPVHVQLNIPDSPVEIDMVEADTVGLHIESFDPGVLQRVAPLKAVSLRQNYFEVVERAVSRLGPNQVSTFVLPGLGEDPDILLEGMKRLVSRGALPYLVPFRPLPGTPLARHPPPPPGYIMELNTVVKELVAEAGLDFRLSRAGCVRCGACTGLIY
jgi:biotin synthase-related radical SAM superfamily protein